MPSPQLADGRVTSSGVYALSATGQRVWSYSPELTLTFAGRSFGPPWTFTDLVVSPGVAPKRLWISAINQWWPSLVVSLDRAGGATVQFVSSGHIYTLAH